MSDLLGGGGGNARAQNGARAASGPVPVSQSQAPPAGMRTPRDIMRQREERKRQAEADAARAAEEQRRAQEEERRKSAERRAAAAGVAGQSRDSGGYRRPVGTAGGRGSGEGTYGGYSSGAVGVGGPVNPPAPVQEPDPAVLAGGATYRPRATSQSQGQPRAAPAPQTTAGASTPWAPQPQFTQSRQATMGGASSQARAGPSAAPSTGQAAAGPSTADGNTTRNPNASSFPHAFERWEQLSSHWEGLTSYWIRRLEQNTEEIRDHLSVQQMSRQITDLSAAGANLFHAVVELQRLRASSERKFQRWFFETRAEQERAQEMQAELENALRLERAARAEAAASLPRAEQAQRNAEKMVAETRRELQISKEEARRAWEELGRREQEERERVLALKEGYPIVIGGVQVHPMQAGMASRQVSGAQRPTTREGPYPTGAQMQPSTGAQEEATESDPRYGYEEGPSPIDTDPFSGTVRGGHTLHHEPDVPSLATGTYQPYPPGGSTPAVSGSTTKTAIPPSTTQQVQPSSSTAQAPARTAPQPGQPSQVPLAPAPPTTSAATTTTSAPPQPATSSAPFYRHVGTYLHDPTTTNATTTAPIPALEIDQQSYVPSLEDTFSEEGDEEYEYDEHGHVRIDAQGRPLLFRRGLRSEGSDEEDVREALAREREHARRYGGGGGGGAAASSATAGAGAGVGTYAQQQPVTTAAGGAGVGYGSGQVDYSGAGYGSGWEGLQRHHHPTRLSDVLEEDERSRTSPSRASQASRGMY